MPSSRSPNGIQFDSPLQRQWMIFDSSGSRRRNAATVSGAASSSKRATKRNSPAAISASRRDLSALRDPAAEELALGVGHLGRRSRAASPACAPPARRSRRPAPGSAPACRTRSPRAATRTTGSSATCEWQTAQRCSTIAATCANGTGARCLRARRRPGGSRSRSRAPRAPRVAGIHQTFGRGGGG